MESKQLDIPMYSTGIDRTLDLLEKTQQGLLRSFCNVLPFHFAENQPHTRSIAKPN